MLVYFGLSLFAVRLLPQSYLRFVFLLLHRSGNITRHHVDEGTSQCIFVVGIPAAFFCPLEKSEYCVALVSPFTRVLCAAANAHLRYSVIVTPHPAFICLRQKVTRGVAFFTFFEECMCVVPVAAFSVCVEEICQATKVRPRVRCDR